MAEFIILDFNSLLPVHLILLSFNGFYFAKLWFNEVTLFVITYINKIIKKKQK